MHPRHHTYYIYWLHINCDGTRRHIDSRAAAGAVRRGARETERAARARIYRMHGRRSGVGLGETRLWGSVSAHKSCFVYKENVNKIRHLINEHENLKSHMHAR